MLETHIKIFLATSVKSITRFYSRWYHRITAQIWDTIPLEPDEHPSMEKPSRPRCPWVCADCDGTKKRWKWSLKIEFMCCNRLNPVSVAIPCLSKSCKNIDKTNNANTYLKLQNIFYFLSCALLQTFDSIVSTVEGRRKEV